MSGVYHKTSGSLKLKGGPAQASGPSNKKKRKKTKSSSSKALTLSEDKAGGKERQREREGSAAREHDDDNGRDDGPIDDGKTEAQRKFEEVQRRRLLEKAAKAATKTHKDRVAEFNKQLENMSEHYDLPRIGPG